MQHRWQGICSALVACLALVTLGSAYVPLFPNNFARRSFFDIQCKGIYDKSKFATLDRVCEDCYNLFREPELHQLCRSKCFSTEYFQGCLEALQLKDEVEKYGKMIQYLGRK